ncbi:MAG: hypothetical protein V4712_17755 [Pseudomonadota bacterium]
MNTKVQGANVAASVHMALQRRTLIPAYHLRKAAHAAHLTSLGGGDPTVKLLFVGESNLVPAPQLTFSQMDSAEGQILRAFERANPFCRITKTNIAYGGATFTSLNMPTLQAMIDAGFTLGPWATGNEAQSLYAVAQEGTPDIIIILCGTNDQENYTPAQRRAVEAGFLAACPQANLIWVTGPQWSRAATLGNATDAATQIGTTATAHHIASTAAMTRRALIDFHRMHMALVQGVDVHRTRVIDGAPAAQAIVTPATLTGTTELDFDLELSIVNTASTWTTRKLRVSTSYQGVNGESFIELTRNAGTGRFDLVFGEIDDGPGRYLTVDTGLTVPVTGTLLLVISLRDDQAQVFLNGVQVFRDLIRRMGGTFAPRISMVATSGAPSLAQAMSAVYRRCAYLRLLPSLADEDALGAPWLASASEGGNAINHWSSRGLAEIVGATLELLDFRIPAVVEGTTEFPGTDDRHVGIGTPAPAGLLHVAKGELADYIPQATANNLVITDPTAAGLSIGTGPAGSARVLLGTTAQPDDAGLTYSAANRDLTLRADDTDVARVMLPGADTLVGAQLLVNIAGGTTLRQVSVGAFDSGGPGYRHLRVPN